MFRLNMRQAIKAEIVSPTLVNLWNRNRPHWAKLGVLNLKPVSWFFILSGIITLSAVYDRYQRSDVLVSDGIVLALALWLGALLLRWLDPERRLLLDCVQLKRRIIDSGVMDEDELKRYADDDLVLQARSLVRWRFGDFEKEETLESSSAVEELMGEARRSAQQVRVGGKFKSVIALYQRFELTDGNWTPYIDRAWPVVRIPENK